MTQRLGDLEGPNVLRGHSGQVRGDVRPLHIRAGEPLHGPPPPLLERLTRVWAGFCTSGRRLRTVSLPRLFRRLRNTGPVLRGETMLATATLAAVKVGADGRVTDYGIVSRKKVTVAFVKRLAAQMAADFSGADEWKWHGSGTDSTAESNAHTGLIAEVESRVAGTQVDISAGSNGGYRSIGTVTYTASYTIVEHGIFNASSSGTLMDRNLLSAGIGVTAGDMIQFTFELTMSPEA